MLEGEFVDVDELGDLFDAGGGEVGLEFYLFGVEGVGEVQRDRGGGGGDRGDLLDLGDQVVRHFGIRIKYGIRGGGFKYN